MLSLTDGSKSLVPPVPLLADLRAQDYQCPHSRRDDRLGQDGAGSAGGSAWTGGTQKPIAATGGSRKSGRPAMRARRSIDHPAAGLLQELMRCVPSSGIDLGKSR
jgi:hypothetical protein